MIEASVEREEIDNLENAINAAIKQSSLLLFTAAVTPGSPISVSEILSNLLVYEKALSTIEKMREGQ